jgi:hypothetical protein
LKNPHHSFDEDFLFGSHAALIAELRTKRMDQERNMWSSINYNRLKSVFIGYVGLRTK